MWAAGERWAEISHWHNSWNKTCVCFKNPEFHFSQQLYFPSLGTKCWMNLRKSLDSPHVLHRVFNSWPLVSFQADLLKNLLQMSFLWMNLKSKSWTNENCLLSLRANLTDSSEMCRLLSAPKEESQQTWAWVSIQTHSVATLYAPPVQSVNEMRLNFVVGAQRTSTETKTCSGAWKQKSRKLLGAECVHVYRANKWNKQ